MGKIFKQYYAQLAKEGILKSILCGFTIGFIAAAVSAIVFWILDVKFFWLSFIILGGIAAAATLIFYYKKFRPTSKDIARRVDDLGLEERLLTIQQLQGDDSYIAMRQREDALAAMNSVKPSFVKIAVPAIMIVAVAVSAVFSASMITVSGLSANDKIKSGKEIYEEVTAVPPKMYTLSYEAEEGGEIFGEIFQEVEEGTDGAVVEAIPEENWAFLEWSDGYAYAVRQDLAVEDDISVFAIFIEVEADEEEGDGEGNGEGEGNGNGEGDEMPKDLGEGEGDGKAPGTGELGGEFDGGKDSSANQVNDGKTFVGDVIGGKGEDAKEQMGGGDYSDKQKDTVGDYFEGLGGLGGIGGD